MRGKQLAGAFGVLAATTAAVAVSSGAIGAGAESTTVRVGVPLDMSGSAAIADIGESELNGVELALSQIEEEGFLGDVTIELLPIDTKGDKQEAVAAVLELVDNEEVDAIVGFTLTPSFMAAVPRAVEAGIPVIALGLAAPGVTDVGENVFRIIPNVTGLYAVSDPVLAEDLGATSAAYLYVSDSETTVAIHEARVAALEEAGVETLEEQAFTTTDTDFRAQLTEANNAGADVIVLTAFPGQFAPIFLQAEELGIETPFISSDGSARDDVLSQAGSAMQCTAFNSVWAAQNDTGRNPQFVEAMGEDADLYSAAGFDAMWVYAEALAAAGSADSEAVITALNDLEDFEGAFGVYDFDENRNPSITGVNLQIRDSEAVLWEPDTECE
jgi:branched-chain amino acid transport system substrate-binding protein